MREIVMTMQMGKKMRTRARFVIFMAGLIAVLGILGMLTGPNRFDLELAIEYVIGF